MIKRVGIDFDGTLVSVGREGDIREIQGAREGVESLKARGFYIIVNTCRTGIARHLGNLDSEVDFIAGALNRFRIPFDEIHIGEKLVAEVYIDDRAVGFQGDWVKAVEQACAITGTMP